MARHGSAIVAAELRVMQSRRDLRDGLRQLRYRLSRRPSTLAAAAVVGAILGILLTRRGRASAMAGSLATALICHAVERLIAGADTPRHIRSS
jgi:hypothetical protein